MKALLVGFVIALAVALAAADVPLVQPKDLAAQLTAKGNKPVVIQVGPNVLFRNRHIAGSQFAGPGSSPQGLELLKQAVAKVPRNAEIVVYCGCCPWDKCPNITPAIALLKQLGYTRAKALYLPENFKKDWTDHGYPVASSLQP